MEEGELIIRKYVDEELLNTLIARLEEVENKMTSVENCYPVGSVYISIDATNPETTLGFGIWEQIEDRFLLAAGSTYTAGSTGGSATVKLSKTQVPAVTGTIAMHSQGIATNIHDATGCFSSGLTNDNKYRAGGGEVSGAQSIGRIDFNNGGTGAAHNNMPPYLVVYIWKRVS